MKATKQSGVALVITLLMLSVITFLTVAFLAFSRRDRASVAVSITQKESRHMADVGLARAQSEIVVRMMGTLDPDGRPEILNYDMMVSRNFLNRYGYTNIGAMRTNISNVSYTDPNGKPLNSAELVQSIANLYYDPRPPVFIRTNSAFDKPLDFRYYIDLNQNGRFETNGYWPGVTENNLNTAIQSFIGEPEWIGVLRNPEFRHSASNPFIGRYAYMVLPIGKTLDINYIHNHHRFDVQPSIPANLSADGFVRDQGYGSWELNLAAYLNEINASYYKNIGVAYRYNTANYLVNTGDPFYDAASLLRYRYGGNVLTVSNVFGNLGANASSFGNDGIDNYGTQFRGFTAFTSANDPDRLITNKPWAGAGNTFNFFTPHLEIMNTSQFANFATRFMTTSRSNNSAARYSFQRLLSTIGSESAPELQVDLPGVDGTWERRTKININYDNSHEIAYGLNQATTNFIGWTNSPGRTNVALRFFTNAADLILRQQFTNDPNRRITNLCVYSSTNGFLVYDEVVHRCLQLAVNIYDAVNPNRVVSITSPPTNFSFPSVFRPLFSRVKNGNSINVYIYGFEEVVGNDSAPVITANSAPSVDRILKFCPFKEITDPDIRTNDNVWGIPWVVGVKKGLPNFNELSSSNVLSMSRKIQFTKSQLGLDHPDGTNQLYYFSLTNALAVEFWNSYTQAISRSIRIVVTNFGRIALTNDAGWATASRTTNGCGTNLNYSSWFTNTVANWPGWVGGDERSFKVPFQTNRIILDGVMQYMDRQGIFAYASNNFRYSFPDETVKFPVYNWTLNITNNLVCAIIDDKTGRTLDFVNLGNRGISSNIYAWIKARYGTLSGDPFITNGATSMADSPPSQGLLNQIAVARKELTRPDQYIPQDVNENDEFASLMGWWTNTAALDPKAAWYQPTALLTDCISWQANDPLVHYTYNDLRDPQGGVATTHTLGKKNIRYQPWGEGVTADAKTDMILKDPNIKRSDDWNFPTNKFPNVGWLGRVHRGTPWQTVYFKAERNWKVDRFKWEELWGRIETYPTNDWSLVDLFTVAPNENASRGTLSVNQTNLAPWAAVFAGVPVPTNKVSGVWIEPTNIPAIFDGWGTNRGINAVRNEKLNRVFHRTGEILEAESLTVASPMWSGDPAINTNITDEVVEAIPQRTLSLLRVGEPRFVIWAYGQSLKPVATYIGSGPNNGIVTNYGITGEALTRTVCRVDRDSNNVPKIVIENFNVVPGE